TVTGGAGAKASLTLDPARRRACWAISPTPGKGKPGGAITLTAGRTTVTLSASPRYVAPETTWQTSPPTLQTPGCDSVPAQVQKAWLASAANARLGFAGGSGSLKRGAASVIYGR